MRKPQTPTANARASQDALIKIRPSIPPTQDKRSLSARSTPNLAGRVPPPGRMAQERHEFPLLDPNAVRLAKLARIMKFGPTPNDSPELIRDAAAMQEHLQNEGTGA